MFEVVKVGDGYTVSNQSVATNHVYVVDVSGSMYGSLPKMRQHLKNIVSLVAGEEDTFSIIYFSGKGQCGVVCEEIPFVDLLSVSAIQKAIDKWLTPIGLTGFHDPIKLAIETGERVANNGKLCNFIMLTDGYDNQSNRNDVIQVCKDLPTVFDSVSFIEYGWYCDRDLLTSMGEVSGATHVFADGIEQYKGKLEERVGEDTRKPRITVDVNKKAKHVVYVHSGEIIIVDVEDNHQVKVPEGTKNVYAIVPKDVLQKQLSEDRLYIVLYYAVKTGNTKLAWRCLEALGDVECIDLFTNSFSRQEVTEFCDFVKEAYLDPAKRFLSGQDFDYLPDENATTIIDVLDLLASNRDDVGMITESRFFTYSRIGAAVGASDTLPAFEDSGNKIKKVKGLVFNSTRANVSIQVEEQGTVEVPENDFGITFVDSFRTKNYTVIRDGILNTPVLDLVVSNDLLDALRNIVPENTVDMVRSIEDEGKARILLNLKTLPVINRSSVYDLSLESFASNAEQLITDQGMVKGLKSLIPDHKDNKVSGMKEKYGEEAAKWLSSLGIRDYGFSPKGSSVKTGDVYMATEVTYKAKGLSSLPSASAVLKKEEAGKKMTISENAVYQGILAGKNKSEKEIEYLLEKYQSDVKLLQHLVSKDVYAMVIGKAWFTDDESGNTEITVGGMKTPLSVEVTRKEIEI